MITLASNPSYLKTKQHLAYVHNTCKCWELGDGVGRVGTGAGLDHYLLERHPQALRVEEM